MSSHFQLGGVTVCGESSEHEKTDEDECPEVKEKHGGDEEVVDACLVSRQKHTPQTMATTGQQRPMQADVVVPMRVLAA